MGCKSTTFFMSCIRESNESLDNAILQYMRLKCLIDAADDTLGCVHPRWSTENEMDFSPIQGRVVSKQRT